MPHDRVPGDEFPLTQEFLAMMLGVRRAGASVARNKLQQDGLICDTRGNITIIDRKGLESASCECYRVLQDRFDSFYAHYRDRAH